MDVAIKDIKTINPKSTDTIVVRFNEIPLDELQIWCEQIQNTFPKNNVVALPSNTHLEICSRELWNDYIQMVNEYIKGL